jgi:hypothetical protein
VKNDTSERLARMLFKAYYARKKVVTRSLKQMAIQEQVNLRNDEIYSLSRRSEQDALMDAIATNQRELDQVLDLLADKATRESINKPIMHLHLPTGL